MDKIEQLSSVEFEIRKIISENFVSDQDAALICKNLAYWYTNKFLQNDQRERLTIITTQKVGL